VFSSGKGFLGVAGPAGIALTRLEVGIAFVSSHFLFVYHVVARRLFLQLTFFNKTYRRHFEADLDAVAPFFPRKKSPFQRKEQILNPSLVGVTIGAKLSEKIFKI